MIFLKKRYTQEEINFMLNIAAGVMIAAAFFSLLVPAMGRIIRFDPDVHVGGVLVCRCGFCRCGSGMVLNAVCR